MSGNQFSFNHFYIENEVKPHNLQLNYINKPIKPFYIFINFFFIFFKS